MCIAANYSARKTVVDGIEVVQLTDAAHHLEVSIAPSLGNMAYEMNAGGKNVLVVSVPQPRRVQGEAHVLAASRSWRPGPTASIRMPIG